MINTVSVTGIVSHIGIADNFRTLLESIDNQFSFPQWTLFWQSYRCPCKVDVVRTKCEHYSCKVVVVFAKLTSVVRTKLTLFIQSVNIVRTKLSLSLQSWRCSYKVVVVLCTKLMVFAQSFGQRKKKVGKLIFI